MHSEQQNKTIKQVLFFKNKSNFKMQTKNKFLEISTRPEAPKFTKILTRPGPT